MDTISENSTLEMDNVISYRGKITQQQTAQIMDELGQIIKENNAKKNGPAVTATYAIENDGMQSIMDIEILVPLSRKINVPSNYTFKPVFRLKNAVKIRHQGNPKMLQNSADELMEYISVKRFMPVTAGYYVTIREPVNKNDVQGLIVDMYVGVTENIL